MPCRLLPKTRGFLLSPQRQQGAGVPRCNMTVREIIRRIEADGWFFTRQRGSHRQYKHATKPGLVTVAGQPSMELAPKTEKSILRQAGLTS